MRARAGRGDGEQFGADIDEAAKQDLFAFEFRAAFGHGMKEPASESAAGAVRIAEMSLENRRDRAIRTDRSRHREPLLRIPAGIEQARIERGFEPLAYRKPRIKRSSADFQM